MNNADLAKQQIINHGVDRYPTVQRQLIKVVEEVGELAKEVNKIATPRVNRSKIKGEMADVALALYSLATKLEIDLDEEMRNKIRTDQRKFTADDISDQG